ncbi:hypothetical protein LTS09_017452 [Friedmanniomyces endolithicus]|nr:hypothetical protein LTS09_017452 [Friedmanniomyces endolithicus]
MAGSVTAIAQLGLMATTATVIFADGTTNIITFASADAVAASGSSGSDALLATGAAAAVASSSSGLGPVIVGTTIYSGSPAGGASTTGPGSTHRTHGIRHGTQIVRR